MVAEEIAKALAREHEEKESGIKWRHATTPEQVEALIKEATK